MSPYKDPEKRREKQLEYNRAWRERNPEYFRNYERKHPRCVRVRHGADYLASRAVYRQRNRERRREYQRRYEATNPAIRLGGEPVRLSKLPAELQPLALLIRETRLEIRKERESRHG